jgi:iron complex outermembrane receptor protein
MNSHNGNTLKKTAIAIAVANALAVSTSAVAQLEEVVVTATKRTTNLQDTPVAITAVSGEMLTELGIESSVDLVKVAPGLKVSWQGPFPSFKMRGGGVAGLNGAAVPLYSNSLAGGNAWAGWLDVERVEVMRGPQGTLYGKNTLGGLVNIIYNKPDTEALDYGVAYTAGDYDLQKLEGFVNVPLGDSLALRLTGSMTEQDPLIENDLNSDGGLRDEDNNYVRAQVLWRFSDSADINFEYTRWDNDSMGNANYGYHYAGIPVNPVTGRATGFSNQIDPRKGTTGITEQGGRTYHDANPAADPRGYFELGGDFDNVWESEIETFSFELNWDVGFADLIARGRRTETENLNMWDVDANQGYPGFVWTGNSGYADGNYGESSDDQVDIVLNSYSDGQFRWGLGFYWADAWDPDENNGTYLWAYVDEELDADTGWPAWTYWDEYGSKSKAVYANAEYDLTDSLTISGGIRRQEDSGFSRRLYSNYYGDQSIWDSGYVERGKLLDASYYTEDFGRGAEFKDKGHTDYRLAFNYILNDDINFYGSFSTGYIAPTISGSNVLDPNELDAYELGMKSILFDGTARLNLALYHSEYTGLSYTVYEAQGNTILSRSETGGGLTSKGLEVEFLWQPNEAFTLNAGVIYDDTTLDEYALAESRFFEGPYNEEGGYYPVRVGNSWFADGDPERPVPTPTYILDGEEASFSPEYIVNLDVSYRFDLGGLGALTPGMTLYHQADFKTMNEEFTFARQDSYTTVDVRATWETPIDRLYVRAYVMNVNDELYKVSQNVFSNGRIMADYGRQRHWGVRLGYNF